VGFLVSLPRHPQPVCTDKQCRPGLASWRASPHDILKKMVPVFDEASPPFPPRQPALRSLPCVPRCRPISLETRPGLCFSIQFCRLHLRRLDSLGSFAVVSAFFHRLDSRCPVARLLCLTFPPDDQLSDHLHGLEFYSTHPGSTLLPLSCGVAHFPLVKTLIIAGSLPRFSRSHCNFRGLFH